VCNERVLTHYKGELVCEKFITDDNTKEKVSTFSFLSDSTRRSNGEGRKRADCP
jgi:hypothetical protein